MDWSAAPANRAVWAEAFRNVMALVLLALLVWGLMESPANHIPPHIALFGQS